MIINGWGTIYEITGGFGLDYRCRDSRLGSAKPECLGHVNANDRMKEMRLGRTVIRLYTSRELSRCVPNLTDQCTLFFHVQTQLGTVSLDLGRIGINGPAPAPCIRSPGPQL
jgi:hypothetical protein